jgi:hypothetical protein
MLGDVFHQLEAQFIQQTASPLEGQLPLAAERLKNLALCYKCFILVADV